MFAIFIRCMLCLLISVLHLSISIYIYLYLHLYLHFPPQTSVSVLFYLCYYFCPVHPLPIPCPSPVHLLPHHSHVCVCKPHHFVGCHKLLITPFVHSIKRKFNLISTNKIPPIGITLRLISTAYHPCKMLY